MTGMNPAASASVTGLVLTPVTSPTNPRSGSDSSFLTFSICPSDPHSPSASPPHWVRFATSDLLTFPASTIRTTSAVSASVYLKPPTNRLSMPRRFSISLISGPPPWTRTTRMPTRLNSTMSLMTAAFSSSFTIALPPYLTTTILSWYFWI